MTIDLHYIPAFSIEDVLLDKDTGAPLSGGQVTFYRDSQRGFKKDVWQITGTYPLYSFIQLPNPMTLSSIGTFEDSLGNPVVPYFLPYDAEFNVDLYYVVVESSDLVPQFVREAVPYVPSSGDSEILSLITNELSNPQFIDVLFDTSTASYTYSVNAVADHEINIAPDWDLVVSAAGAGTITLTQLKPAGTLNTLTNPGTLLQISSAGLSSLILRQRIYGSPNLWGSGYLSASFVAKTYSGTSPILNMYYSQSNGTLNITPVLLKAATLSGTYTSFPGSALIDASTSSENYPDAYIDIYFDLPLSIQIDITSVMVASTGATSIADIGYDQESNARMADHLFHYYQPQINFKPIPSLLTAWDFPLNPAQPLGSSVTINTTSAYKWDQTIGQSVVGNITVVRNAVTGGFQATTANATEAFYVMQYLTGAQAKKMLGSPLAVNINAFRTQAGGAVTARVFMYRGSAAAVFPLLPLTIGGATPLSAGGIFTSNTTAAQGLNWTLIPRGDMGQASGTLSTVTTTDYSTLNDVEDLKFTGWEIVDTAQIADTDKFCIVVTFQCPTTASVVVIDSISVVQGDIPTRPAPQTQEQVIEECYAYYESSKAVGVPVTTNSAINSIIVPQIAAAATAPSTGTSLYTRTFGLPYQVNKVKVPTTTLYSEGGTADRVTAYIYDGGSGQIGTTALTASTLWTQQNSGTKSLSFLAKTSAQYVNVSGTAYNIFMDGFISFHYESDARPGQYV